MLDLTWPLVRPIIFSMEAEVAHERTLSLLAGAGGLIGGLARLTMGPPDKSLAREVFGLPFAGPVGLAAGMDKNGVAIPFWPSIGFGFIEVGTVTAHAQQGNPKPRMYRLVKDGAIINRMGFNNHGSAELADRLRQLKDLDRWPAVPLGCNIGKSKITPLDEAADDYVTSVKRLVGLADWFTVNVSSPNTPGLRKLQEPAILGALLGKILEAAGDTPVALKLAPDLEPDALAEAVDLAIRTGVSGIIATNTTITRPGLSHDPDQGGGLSGRPLWPLAHERILTVLDAACGRVPVIGCGGVHTAQQASELLDAGCAAIQVYSGLVFEGPGLPTRLNKALMTG
ncbi:MAG: dihydroorotate dehydrogenase [Kiritimatiellia bacterium]|jgi:dihydroorotate dehydrogenase